MRNYLISLFAVAFILSGNTGASANDRVNEFGIKFSEKRPDLKCLALNIYFEARGEPTAGKIAVGHVVLNRVADRRFPKQICSVVRQGGEIRRNRCQFSWWCDGRSDEPRDQQAWRESVLIAALINRGATSDPTRGSLWYHATYVKPGWARQMKKRVKIGKHIFYVKPKLRVSRNVPIHSGWDEFS